MASRSRISPGSIYWLDNCPGLDRGGPKRRPVIIVIAEDDRQSSLDPVFVVPATTEPSNDHDRLALPNLHDNPNTVTGLPEPCAALPRWVLPAFRDDLPAENHIGRLPDALLFALIEAVLCRLDGPDEP